MNLSIRRENWRLWGFGGRDRNRFVLARWEWMRQKEPPLREVSVSLVWEPRDLWIGAYIAPPEFGHLILFICLIPCIALRLHFKRHWGASGIP